MIANVMGNCALHAGAGHGLPVPGGGCAAHAGACTQVSKDAFIMQYPKRKRTAKRRTVHGLV